MPVIKRIYLMNSKRLKNVRVVVNFSSEILPESDPRVKQFVGDYLANAEIWMRKQGNFKMERLR